VATLCNKNSPDDLHNAIRKRARENGSSMRAEVIRILKENVVPPAELRRRRKIFDKLLNVRTTKPAEDRPYPRPEEMIREDRER